MAMKIGILIVSDRCYKNEKTYHRDIERLVEEYIPHRSVLVDCVPREKDKIKKKILEWTDGKTARCDVILTMDEMGMAANITTEVTSEFIEKELPGILYVFVSEIFQNSLFAMLTGVMVGVKNKKIFISLPGSIEAVKENFPVFNDLINITVFMKAIYIDRHTENTQEEESKWTPSKVVQIPSAVLKQKSPYEKIEIGTAFKIITSVCVQTYDIEVVDWKKCHCRVLAEDLFSNEPWPPFRAAIKNGYAFKYEDRGDNLKIQRVSKAGDQLHDNILEDGYCVRISTGAPVPKNADALVPMEDTAVSDDDDDDDYDCDDEDFEELKIEITGTSDYRKEIREIGSDIAKHVIILKKGKILNPTEVGIIAKIGKTDINVFRQPITGVISTGNELQLPGALLQPGCVRDSNKITLLCLLSEYGYPGIDYGIAKDNPNDVKRKLERALAECDFIITSGGSSIGENDIIESVLIQDFNATIHFGSVNIKPGKSTKFASCVYDGKVKYIFVLPGDPGSAMVTLLLFALPALRHFENRTNPMLPLVSVKASFIPKCDGLSPELQRVQIYYLNNEMRVRLPENEMSSESMSRVYDNGLLVVRPSGLKYSDLGLQENLHYHWCFLLNRF